MHLYVDFEVLLGPDEFHSLPKLLYDQSQGTLGRMMLCKIVLASIKPKVLTEIYYLPNFDEELNKEQHDLNNKQ